MRFVLLFFISCIFAISAALPQSQRSLSDLYSHYLKAIFYIKNGDFASGLDELEKAKDRDPQSVYIRLKMAGALISLGRNDEAEKVLKEAKKINPDSLDAYLSLIFLYSYTKKEDAVEAEYESFLEKAHETKPKDVSIAEYLAQFYFYKNKPQEAIRIYEKILKNEPEYIEAFFWLGYLYEEVDRHKEATDIWERGLELNPAYAPILNSLGYVYVEMGINFDNAEIMIKKALDAEPENGAYLDSLGWLYFKKGDFKKAEEYLEKAISYTKDPDIYEHLGDLFIKTGNVKKGIEYYKEGLLHFPDSDSLKNRIQEYESENKAIKE